MSEEQETERNVLTLRDRIYGLGKEPPRFDVIGNLGFCWSLLALGLALRDSDRYSDQYQSGVRRLILDAVQFNKCDFVRKLLIAGNWLVDIPYELCKTSLTDIRALEEKLYDGNLGSSALVNIRREEIIILGVKRWKILAIIKGESHHDAESLHLELVLYRYIECEKLHMVRSGLEFSSEHPHFLPKEIILLNRYSTIASCQLEGELINLSLEEVI